MRRRRVRRRTVLGAVFLLAQGCATLTPNHTLDAGQRALADASCYGGVPIDRNPELGPTELVIRAGYALEFSSTDKNPVWVCESVGAEQLSGHLKRGNAFRADPDLKGPKSYPEDYARSGYDRGHMAPAGNQTRDPDLKDQTFYMSNMAPQRPSLNRGIWRKLEEQSRAWVIRYGHAYEWTGPIRCDAQLRAALPRASACRRVTIGKSQVAVPPYFYKIILVQVRGAWNGIAFVIPNEILTCPCRLESYRVAIDDIERETGIEFMPNVPSRERRELDRSSMLDAPHQQPPG